MVSLSHKTKQFFWLILKIAIVFSCLFFIYWKLTQNKTLLFTDFLNFCLQHNLLALQTLFFLSCFSTLNWFFEIKKWQILINSFQKINFSVATKQCLSSLTVSLFTPNRLGEYVAKAIYFQKKRRKKIIAYNAINNGYQLGATLFFGVFAFAFFSYNQHFFLASKKIIIVFITLSLILACIYFLLQKNSFFKQWKKKWIVFQRNISKKTHYQIALLSVLRYALFSHQFYFITLTLGVSNNYLITISAICSMYLLSSFLPMIAFLDVVVKSSVAIWIFSFLKINPSTILVTTTLLWIFNFVIPALIGSYFVLLYKPKVLI